MIFLKYCYAMKPSKGEESGEMNSSDDQGDYVPKSGTHNSSIQGMSDALMALESEITMVQPPSEYALLLEVTMADCPRGIHALSHSPGMREWSCTF